MTIEDRLQFPPRPNNLAPPTMRSRPRVVWWAWVGVVFGAVEAVTIVGWIANGHATPTHAIAADVPSYVKISAVIVQALCVLACIGVVIYLVRQYRQQRTFTFAAVITIAGFSTWWQDSLMNYVRPQAGYNSYYLNLGVWNSDVPGWLTWNGHALPEAALLEGPAYFCMLLYAMLGAAAMRWARRRWPAISVAGLIVVAFSTLMVFNLVFELSVNIPARAYGWSSTISWLTLFGGEDFRYPIYEGVLSTFVFAPAGVLLYFLDDHVLAVAGVLNVCFLAGYTIPITWIGLHTDRHYILPSYISNGTCGVEVAIPCPPTP
jgi:hypothetical protein